MDKEALRQLLHRQTNTNKYDFGHILIVGGSQEMVGAPVLAARAALRCGAGLVTIASTHDATALIDRDIEEMMTISLPSWDDEQACVSTLAAFIDERHVSVVIVGPGLPEAADNMIRQLVAVIDLPIIVDAESFTAFALHLAELQAAATTNKRLILTPHPGEYARLTQGLSKDEQAADAFATHYGVTLVLKHDKTLITSATGDEYQNTTGNPGLATAGSGDVLSGVIAALVAQGLAPYQAAVMGVYLHGLAGDIAAATKTEPGMISSDIIESLPAALKQSSD